MARTGMETSAKFRLLVRRVKLAEPFVRGLLETLWDVANATGNPTLGSPDAVEAASKWPGESGEWFAALRDGGWIDEVGNDLWAIHDYWDHAQDYVVSRESKRFGMTRVEFLKKFRKIRKSSGKLNKNLAKSSPPQSSPVKTRQVTETPTEFPCLPAEPAGGPEHPSDSPEDSDQPSTPPPATPRQRDALFDAVAEIGCADAKLDGPRIGRVCKVLRSADPPYTPDEVRQLPAALQAHGLEFALTVEAIGKHIGRVRAPVPAKGRSPPGRPGADNGRPSNYSQWKQQKGQSS